MITRMATYRGVPISCSKAHLYQPRAYYFAIGREPFIVESLARAIALINRYGRKL